jgi:hypothetical protein
MTEGWIETQIAESVRRGSCPICDAVEASRKSYLTWMRTNLNDAKFQQSVSSSGGYCLSHLHEVMDSLGANPYNRLNLLKVMRSAMLMLVDGQPVAGCHLCTSLRDTTTAYAVVINSSRIQTINGRPVALCRIHVPLLKQRPGQLDGRSAAARESPARRPTPTSREVVEFLNMTAAILKDFHRKNPEVLGREVERCEALMTRAMQG